MSNLVSTHSAKPVLFEDTQIIDFFKDFLETDVGNGKAADDTQRTYLCHLKQFVHWCQNQTLNPVEATFANLKRFRRWLVKEQQYQTATISLKLAVLRRFYDALLENEYISFNPALRLRPPTEVRDPAATINFLENEEMNRLLDSLPTENTVHALRDRLLISLMVLQGCRTVDLHRVTMENMVKNGKNIGLRVSSKRHTRVVPLTPDLAKLLRRYLRARRKAGETITDETPLFISVARNNEEQDKPLSRRSFRRIVDKYLGVIGLKELPCPKTLKKLTGSQEKSNLPTKAREFSQHKPKPRKLSAHSLRHTAATLALRAGATLEQVQDLLGHTDPKTTMIYAHIGDRWLHNPALLLSVNKPKLEENLIRRLQRLQQSLRRTNPLELTLNEEETLRILETVCA
ncbi:tyrosine-type recombinase/integrase [Crocosphaera chwakensis]|uniref:Phage integrase n=1 Tax=Crocosphaera chwakensis CCY0110 TaxID=391612 RepID=A3IYJ8_9CHRO|nr:tyrosine-type recombinase/integrase [Crocosphaera chwakensis]EAZ88447.1 phage integrase [Crocosphaera chwakensis CCY0110]